MLCAARPLPVAPVSLFSPTHFFFRWFPLPSFVACAACAAQWSQDSYNSITAAKFSDDGVLFAYSYSYDWSKGVNNPLAKKPSEIYVRLVTDDDIVPKPPKR